LSKTLAREVEKKLRNLLKKKEKKLRKKEKDRSLEKRRETALTFLAAALKASLCEMSGLPALMRWISSLQSHSPAPRKSQKKKRGKGDVRSMHI